jgi:hypothetical protein
VSDVKYTRRNDTSVPSAASAGGLLLVVPAQTARGASPELRQRLALLARAPWTSVQQTVAADLPIVVGIATNPRDAAELQARLQREHGLHATVLAPASGIGLAFAGLFVCSLALALAGLTWAFYSPTFALLWMILAVIAGGLGIGALRRWTMQRQQHHDAAEAQRRGATAVDATAIERLSSLRALSLHDDVPVEAQADLWRQFDELEASLLHNPGASAALLEALEPLRAALLTQDHASPEATAARLRATTQRVATAVRESRG